MSETGTESAAITVVEAELGRLEHQEAIVRLLDAYSMDPMGAGKPLSVEARANVIATSRINQHQNSHSTSTISI